MNENVKKLYDTLTKDGYDTGEFNSFATQIQNPDNLKKLYETLSKDNYDVGEFDSFSNQLITPMDSSSNPQDDKKPGVWDYVGKGSSWALNPVGTAAGIAVGAIGNKVSDYVDQSHHPSTLQDKKAFEGMPAESTSVQTAMPEVSVNKDNLPRYDSIGSLLQDNELQIEKENAEKKAFEAQLEEARKKKHNDYKLPSYQMTGSAFTPMYTQSQEDRRKMKIEDTRRSLLNEAERLQKMSQDRKAGDGNELSPADFAKAFGRNITNVDSWTLGLMDIDKNITFQSIAKKAEKVGLDNLDEREQDLLEAAALNVAAQTYYSGDLSVAQKAGMGTAESIPYAVQFALTRMPGSAISAPVKKALQGAMRKMLKKGVKNKLYESVVKGTIRGASAAADAAGMSLIQPSMYANITERTAGKANFKTDENGNISYSGRMDAVSVPEAIAKGFAANTIENVSEMSGGMFHGVVNTVKNRIPFAGKLLDKMETNAFLSPVQKLAEQTGFNGTIEEFLEEQVNTGLNALLVGDNKFSDLVDADQQLATLMSVAAMGGAITVGNGAAAAPVKRRINKRYTAAKTLVEDLFEGEEFDRFRQSLSNLPLNQRPSFINQVAVSKDLNDQQIRDLHAYATRQSEYEGYMGAVRDKINDETVKAQDEINKISNPVMGAVVSVQSPLSDKPINIVGGYLSFNEEGFIDPEHSSQTIYYLDEYGKRQMSTPDKFEKLVSSIPLDEAYSQAMDGVADRIIGEEEQQIEPPFKNEDQVVTKDGLSGEVTGVNMDEKGAYVHLSDGRREMIPFEELQLVEPAMSQEEVQTPTPETTEVPTEAPEIQEAPTTGATDIPATDLPATDNLETAIPETGKSVEAQPEEPVEPAKPVFPLTKKGRTDYSKITEPQMYADALVYDFGEEAPEVLSELISEEEARLKKKQKIADARDRRWAMKESQVEIERLKEVQRILSPQEETELPVADEIVSPEQKAEEPADAASLKENLNDKEYAEWALDESDDADELLSAYQTAKELSNKENKLLPWQQELLGKKINPASFYRFGDRNHINGTFARAWLKKDGYSIDTLADELSEQGITVTPEDIVDFMQSNPTNYVRKTSDLQTALSKKWAEAATKEAGVPISGPESTTGKVFLAMKRKGEQITPRSYQNELQTGQVGNDDELVNEWLNNKYDDFTQMAAPSVSEDEVAESLVDDRGFSPEEYEEATHIINEWKSEDDFELNTQSNGNIKSESGTDSQESINQEIGDAIDESNASDVQGNYTSEDSAPTGNVGESSGRGEDVTTVPSSESEVTAEPSNAGQEEEAKVDPPLPAPNETMLETIQRIADPQNKKEAVVAAEKEVNTQPTEAQKEAGNYKKGHVKVNGFNITIEQPSGSVRSGKDASGKEWSVTMNNTYGYFKGTKGKDGDHIDVFLGPKLDSREVFVVDQVKPDGSFDEHKVMMGFDSVDEAKQAYLSNYEEGWSGLGNITPVSLDEFKKWVDSSKRKTKAFADYGKVKGNATDGGLLFRTGEELTPEEQKVVDRAKSDGAYLKAPNGKESNLNPKQWAQVRTKAFKEWFGDWEKAARIEKLRNSKPVEIIGDEYKGKYELNRDSAKQWILDNLRNKDYKIEDTGEVVTITKVGAKKVTSHSMGNEAHLKSISVIPDLLQQAIFIGEMPNMKNNEKYDTYRYYICGLRVGNTDYTVKLTVGVKDGKKYYDHALTEIEKGKLIESISPSGFKTTGGAPNPSSAIDKDKKLLSILQTNSSKVVDENGEPLMVYHGTLVKGIDRFKKDMIGSRYSYDESGFFFTNKESIAKDYATSDFDSQVKGEIIPVFLNLRKPIAADNKWAIKEGLGNALKDMDSIEFWDNYQSFMLDEVADRQADGVIINDGSTKMFVAFEPNQIKSATENKGMFSVADDRMRFRSIDKKGAANLDKTAEVNKQFNEELQQQIEGTLPKGHVYALGKPGVALLSAGIPDLPIELSADRLELKSSKEYKSNHPFDLKNIKNLPDALNHPIAVFESRKVKGGSVVLTELKQDGNNFVVAIHVRKSDESFKIDIEVNSIRSLYPKDRVGGIIEWINSGLMRWVDKEKASDFLSTQWPNYIGGGKNEGSPNESTQPNGPITLQADIDSEAKISKSFENPTYSEGEKMAEIKNISSELNTPVRIVRNVNDLPDDARERKAKGYYDPKTGETVIVLPNNTDVADVQKTMLHEIVAHKGLRGLLGDKLDDMLDHVYRGLPTEQRLVLTKEAYGKYKGNVRIATEEYLAGVAEKNIEPSVWQKIKGSIKDFFRSMGIDLRMTDADIQYLLWKSKNRLKRDGSMLEVINDVVSDTAMKERLYRQADASGKAAPIVSSDKLKKENPVDQIRIVNEAMILSEEEKNDLSAKIRNDKFRESWQDRFIPVRRFQEMIEKKFGEKIKEFCDAYMYEPTISSRSTDEIERYKKLYLNPLLNIVAKIGSQEETNNYLKAKHGLERNAYMRKKAVEQYKAKQEERLRTLRNDLEGQMLDMKNQSSPDYEKISAFEKRIEQRINEESAQMATDLADYEKKQTRKDYAGLTGLQRRLWPDKQKLDEKEFEKYIKEFEGKHDVKPLWKAVKKATRFALDKQLSSGCIDKATYNMIDNMYEFYVPLREWEEETAGDVYDYFFKNDHDVLNSPLKNAKGRKSEAGDPLANIASMSTSSIFLGNKNLMKQHFLRLVSNYKTNLATVSPTWYVSTPDVDGSGVSGWEEVRPNLREDMSEEEYLDTLENFYSRMEELQKQGLAKTKLSGVNLGIPIKYYQAEQHVVKVKENGKEITIYIQGDPRVAQAINGLNNVKAYDTGLLKAMNDVKQFMTKNFTTRNPTFVARNLSRDMIYAVTMHGVREGAGYTKTFLQVIPGASGAIARFLRGKADMSNEMDRMFQEFLRNGGETGFVALTSYETYKKDIRRMVNKAARTNALSDGWEAVGKTFEGWNRWAEDLSRFSTYVASRKSGRSVMKSISDAKEVTVNFNRKGSGANGNWLASLSYFFLNAGIQGMYNFGRTFKGNPFKTTLAATAWATLGAVMPYVVSALTGGDDDYDNIPEYVRQNSIVIPLGGKMYASIPLPIEFRAFYGIGDIVYQVLTGKYKDRNAAADILERLLDATPRNFIGGSGSGDKGVIGAIAANAMPDVFKPVIEAYITNTDFTGRPIVKDTEYNKYEPEYQRVYKGTAKELLAVSEFINNVTGGDYATKGWADSVWLNPGAVEHLLESYFGGVGKTVMQTYKTMQSPVTGDFALRSVPVASGFMYQLNSSYPTTVINERYQKYIDLLKEVQSRERMYDKGMPEDASLGKKYEKFMGSREKEVAEMVQTYKKEIDKLYKDSKLVETKDKEEMNNVILNLKLDMLEQIDKMK